MGKHSAGKAGQDSGAPRTRINVQAIEFRVRKSHAAPESSSSRYVGRVGALAVALGIGAAVASMPIAAADTTGSGGSTGTSAADTPSVPSTKATRGGRVASRGSAEAPASAGSRGSTDSSTDSSAAESEPAGTPRGRRTAAAPDSRAETRAVNRNRSDLAPEGDASPSVDHPVDDGSPVSAPEVSLEPQSSAVEAPGDVVTAAEPVRVAAAASNGGSFAAPAARAAVAKASPAAASGGVSQVGQDLLSWLAGGGSGDGPAALPLAWSAVALSRRELQGGSSGAARTRGRPARTTTTGVAVHR